MAMPWEIKPQLKVLIFHKLCLCPSVKLKHTLSFYFCVGLYLLGVCSAVRCGYCYLFIYLVDISRSLLVETLRLDCKDALTLSMVALYYPSSPLSCWTVLTLP